LFYFVFFFIYILKGVPVWTGRKMYTRYRHSSRLKRNFAIAGGVMAAVSFLLIFLHKTYTLWPKKKKIKKELVIKLVIFFFINFTICEQSHTIYLFY